MQVKKPALITIGAVLLLFGVFSSAVAGGRSFWRKVNAGVGVDQVCGVAMSPSGQHIVINAGFSAHSSDRGITWEVYGHSGADIMDFGDETHLFGVGTGQDGTVAVLYSTDYGANWTFNFLPQNLIDFREVDFIDSVHGWAVGDKDFTVTTNDGWQTWSAKAYGLPDDSGRYFGRGVTFLDTLQGFVSGWLVPIRRFCEQPMGAVIGRLCRWVFFQSRQFLRIS